MLVQGGTVIMAQLTHQRRFTVSVDQADYDALQEFGRSASPPVNLQYLVRLAIHNLLEQRATKQFAFPLEQRP